LLLLLLCGFGGGVDLFDLLVTHTFDIGIVLVPITADVGLLSRVISEQLRCVSFPCTCIHTLLEVQCYDTWTCHIWDLVMSRILLCGDYSTSNQPVLAVGTSSWHRACSCCVIVNTADCIYPFNSILAWLLKYHLSNECSCNMYACRCTHVGENWYPARTGRSPVVMSQSYLAIRPPKSIQLFVYVLYQRKTCAGQCT
jgi:hypothetical protein